MTYINDIGYKIQMLLQPRHMKPLRKNCKMKNGNYDINHPKKAQSGIQLCGHGLRNNIRPKLVIVYLFPSFVLLLMFLLIPLFVVDGVDIDTDLDVDVDQ